VAYALAYAHGRSVVHRDIKPDNIMLERATGRALLMDFGISRTISTVPGVTAQGLTRVGEVVGTPEFMSPEQASADALTGRSDLYSLGLVAWFAATGRLAISGDSTQKIIMRQITEAIPSLRGELADMPEPLAAAIERCVQKDPDDRFASAESLVDALDAAKLMGPEIPLPIRMFAEEASQAGLVLIGGVLLGALLYSYLLTTNEFKLEAVLPMMLYVAMLWARLTQPLPMARTLVRRGFSVSELSRGMGAVMRERDDARTQLRSDSALVGRRRRQIILWAAVLAVSYVVREYVLRYQRTEIRPGVHAVFPLGVRLLYAVFIASGIAIVGLLRSPFRRPIGEWLYKWFWLGWPGTAVLALAARGVPAVDDGSVTLPRATRDSAKNRLATSAVMPAPGQDVSHEAPRIAALERRIAALEQRTHQL
jgi:eukaryotic-like serine/threonine-protein kinase